MPSRSFFFFYHQTLLPRLRTHRWSSNPRADLKAPNLFSQSFHHRITVFPLLTRPCLLLLPPSPHTSRTVTSRQRWFVISPSHHPRIQPHLSKISTAPSTPLLSKFQISKIPNFQIPNFQTPNPLHQPRQHSRARGGGGKLLQVPAFPAPRGAAVRA